MLLEEILLPLLAVIVVIITTWYIWSRRKLYKLTKQLPCGLKEYPIIGHAYIFAGNSEDRMKGLKELGLAANKHGGITYFWLGNVLFLSLTDPKAIEVISKTCLDKDAIMRFFWPLTGNGSVFAPVKHWYPRRKILVNFFKLTNLNSIISVFDKQSQILVNMMKVEVDNGNFAAWTYFTSYTFDTIAESVANVNAGAQESGGHWGIDLINDSTQMISERVLQPWLHPDFIYKRLPVYQRLVQNREKALAFIHKKLQAKKKEFAKTTSSATEVDSNRMSSLIETVLRTPGIDKFTDEDMSEEAIVVVTAANDTSAVGASFTAVMLSRYPEVQDKVYQELMDVFGDSDRSVDSEDMSKLKYLDAVIKETLRLYPPVPVITRQVFDDVVLPSGVTLVPGTSVMIHIWGTHRNAEYWGADADVFRPERFLEGPLSHPAMFIPFSYSVRGCIGNTYAMFSMKTALANLLRNYRLLPPANMTDADLRKPLKVKFEIMMKAVDDFILRIEERK